MGLGFVVGVGVEVLFGAAAFFAVADLADLFWGEGSGGDIAVFRGKR